MKLPPALGAEAVEIVARRTGHARVTIAGVSMQPLLRAGMVVDIEPLIAAPRIGDILVFKSRTGLIAHRLVGGESLAFRAHSGIVARVPREERIRGFITSGDAYPDRAETVPPRLVVGRVTAVWTGTEPDARRIDDARYRLIGIAFARSCAVRSLAGKVRPSVAALLADPVRGAPPAAFAVLMTATTKFESGHLAAGVSCLQSLCAQELIAMARRHHASGLISGWLDAAAGAGVTVSDELRAGFRRIRWTNALQAGHVLTCVRDVRDRFVAADIPHIFLKGGARLAAAEPGADLQFSGDLDVMVPAESAERALATLRCGGYRDVLPERKRVRFAALHHREPLCSPDVDLPVEIHVAIAPSALVSQRLDYAALAPSSRTSDGPVGEVRGLDGVASAVHLAYHARDFSVWRDIVLLSRLLRAFELRERARFDAYIRAETRDGLRIATAVAAAEAIVHNRTVAADPVASVAVKRYIAWVTLREDLPRRFAHTDIVEAVIGRCRMPKLAVQYARHDAAGWIRCWVRGLAALLPIARIARARKGKPDGVGVN